MGRFILVGGGSLPSCFLPFFCRGVSLDRFFSLSSLWPLRSQRPLCKFRISFFYAFAADPPISFLFLLHPNTASLTRSMVPCATARALFEPASKISRTPLGSFSHFTRRSRTGAIHLIKFSAIAALHSMQPIPAVVHPWRTHSSRPGSSAENSLCQSYTGHTSGFPGSVRLLRAGSVTITFVFARMSASLSLSVIVFP